MRAIHPSSSFGFSLTEVLLVLGALTILSALVFAIYPRVMVSAHAAADRRAMSAAYINLMQLIRAGGGSGSFNSDSSNPQASLAENPVALAKILRPLRCHGDWGSLYCNPALGVEQTVDFMSIGTCQDPGCSSVGPPYNVFSIRVAFYDVTVEECLALIQGFGIGQSATGASAIYTINSSWEYKALFLNTATIATNVDACNDTSSGNIAMVMFDHWPWGDPWGNPHWGG